MPIPNHLPSCGTRTFPYNCPDCNQSVFFLSCTCGSKVFFNSIGSPWPIHNCRERQIREAIEFLQITDSLTSEEIYKFIDKKGSIIPDDYIETIERILGKRKHKIKVVPIKFDKTITHSIGRIMNINSGVNLFKKIGGSSDNDLAIKSLGELAKDTFNEITIRQAANDSYESWELNVLISKKMMKKYLLQEGNHVVLQLKPAKSLLACWVIEECQII